MTNATQSAESVTLYFKEGSSDKVYQASLKRDAGGWSVDFAYGRRGSTMNVGNKVARVPYEKAKSVFDKLVREKTAKGYTPGEDGTAYKGTTSEERDTGERPQLLNDIDEAEVERLIEDCGWGMQEKMDGKRMMVKANVAGTFGINRKGLIIVLPETVRSSASKVGGEDEFTIDGEAVGDEHFAFDLLTHAGMDLRSAEYLTRHKLLAKLIGAKGGAIKLVPLAVTTKEKRALFEKIKAARGEGVVFKRLLSPYKAGRPATGGDQLKHKFYATGSFIVAKVNAKRSVALEVLVDGKRTQIGNVTIPPNKAVPDVGEVVEIRYLYCYKNGSLYQPIYLGKRDDIDPSECTDKQIKYKAGEDDEA